MEMDTEQQQYDQWVNEFRILLNCIANELIDYKRKPVSRDSKPRDPIPKNVLSEVEDALFCNVEKLIPAPTSRKQSPDYAKVETLLLQAIELRAKIIKYMNSGWKKHEHEYESCEAFKTRVIYPTLEHCCAKDQAWWGEIVCAN